MCLDTGHHTADHSHLRVGKLKLGRRPSSQAPAQRLPPSRPARPLLPSAGHPRTRPDELPSRGGGTSRRPRSVLDRHQTASAELAPPQTPCAGARLTLGYRIRACLPARPARPCLQGAVWRPGGPFGSSCRPGAAALAEPSQVRPAAWLPRGSFAGATGSSYRWGAAHPQPLSPAPPLGRGAGQEAPGWAGPNVVESRSREVAARAATSPPHMWRPPLQPAAGTCVTSR